MTDNGCDGCKTAAFSHISRNLQKAMLLVTKSSKKRGVLQKHCSTPAIAILLQCYQYEITR